MLSRHRLRRVTISAVVLLLVAAAQAAHASYSLSFQGLAQTLNTGGSITLSSPSGIVVDSSGNVFVSDTGNSRIVEVNALGTATVLTINGLSTALTAPAGIAIDDSGNLYVADTGNNRVVKIDQSGEGSVVDTGSVTLSSAKGVALDQSGNLFIADGGNNRIVEVASGGSAAVLAITVSSGSATLNSPQGLAVNPAGNLYIADAGNNRIVSVAAGSTTGVVASILGGVTLNNPTAVALDRIGNVLIADTGNNRIAEIDTSDNGTVLYANSETLNAPLAVALDVFGTVYIADTGDNRGLVVAPPVNGSLTPSDTTYSLNKSAVGFGHVQLGSTNAVTLTLPFTTGSAGLGAVGVLTAGAQGLDFTSGVDTTCDSTTTASMSCSVEVKFLPTAPGLRRGAVVLYDASLNPILTIPLYGWADSPVAALTPSIGSVLSTGGLAASNPYQIAFDGANNLYVGDYSGKNVIKVPAGGGTASVVALGTPGSVATQNLTGVAIDGAGNLFIGDHQNSRIVVVTPGGVASVLGISGLSPALGFPTALAFDAAGNLYIADFTNGRIVEVSTLVVAGSTSSGKATVIGTGSYSFSVGTVTGMTVDAHGNIYVAARTQNSSHIIKVTAAGVASAVAIPSNITPAISNPQGVAADPMDNLYIVDTTNNRIVEITSAGVASAIGISGLTSPATLGSTLFGVTIDASGNLYISDWTNNRIVYVNVSGAALTFPSTAVGSNSTAKTATVTNLGNQPLSFSTDPTYTADFISNTADTNLCTLSTSLLAGTLCDVSVQFAPQSVGSLSAGITVTNNTLNVAESTQQVSVSGTSFSPADTTATAVGATPTSIALGQTVALTATVTDTYAGHTSTVPTGSVSFIDTIGTTVTTISGGSAVPLSGGTAALTGVTLSGVGTHTITANYAGVSGTFATSSGSTTVAVGKGVITITLASSANPQLIGAPVTFTATATSAAGSPVGSVTFYDGTTSLGDGDLVSGVTSLTTSSLAPGSHTITAVYNGDTTHLTGTSAALTETIGKAAVAVALSSSANPQLVQSAITFTATVTPSMEGVPLGSVTFYDGTASLGDGDLVSGVATLTTSSLAVGSHSITAVYNGDSTFMSTTSAALTQSIADFSVSGGGGGSGGGSGSGDGTTQTTVPGGTATYSLSIVPSGSTTFPTPTTLTVTGLPAGATATLPTTGWTQSASTLWTYPANTTFSAVQLNIQLPSVTAQAQRDGAAVRRFPPLLWGMLLLPFAARLRRTGRHLGRFLSLLLLALAGSCAIVALNGCGSSNGFFGQPQQSYTVTVTVTTGTVSHSTNLKLTVE